MLLREGCVYFELQLSEGLVDLAHKNFCLTLNDVRLFLRNVQEQ